MVDLSLPTCKRCQKRKKRCDNLLPNCTTCKEDGVECIIYDHGIQQNIPRQYVAALSARVDQLSAEVARLEQLDGSSHSSPSAPTIDFCEHQESLQISPMSNSPPVIHITHVEDAMHQTCFFVPDKSVAVFVGPGTASSLGLATARMAAKIADESGRPLMESISLQSVEPSLNWLVAEKLEKSVVPQPAIRDLIENHYFPVLHPHCPAVDPSQIVLDTNIKRLPLVRRFFVIITAAIAAAHRGRNHPEMYTTALILRNWADQLSEEVLKEHNEDSLQALLLLVLYELVDPSRRLIWTLLGVVCRMCVKLGWHRSTANEHDSRVIQDESFYESSRPYSPAWRRRLFQIIYKWERSVCDALGRPTILPDEIIDVSVAVTASPAERQFRVLQVRSQLNQKIAEASRHNCIVTPELVAFVHNNIISSKHHDASWLLLHPVMRHSCENCVEKAQWASQLRTEIERAAISLIDSTFHIHRTGKIISVWLATLELFSAGAVLVDMALERKFQSPHRKLDVSAELVRSLGRCSSILAAFAEIWPGARTHRDVFDGLADHLTR